MKAITQDRYGSADVLRLSDVDEPRPGAGEVLVEVRAAGVDPGVWIFLTGTPYAVRLASGLRRPRVAVRGRDLAGVVAAVGPDVTRFKPGDEAFGTTSHGSYAEYAVATENRLAIKPANVSFAQAAATPISGATALQAVRDAGRVTSGQRVMVIGAAGGVGSFAVQLARAAGATVTAVCGPGKGDLVRSLGAADVIDYTQAEVDRDGPVYDVVIDTAGDRPLWRLRRAAVPRGTVVVVGGRYQGGEVLGGYWRQLRTPFASLLASQRLVGLTARERAADLDVLRERIESGAVTPLVDRTYPLAETANALRHFEHRHAAGKVVVTV